MSVQAIAWVLDRSKVKGSERLVLISVANHADAEGANSWPSIATICREACLGETRVKRALRDLEAQGVLRIEERAGGSRDVRADRRPNRYTILPLGNGGQTGAPRPRGSENGGHGGHTGVQEPSLNHPLDTSPSDSAPAGPTDADDLVAVSDEDRAEVLAAARASRPKTRKPTGPRR